MIQNLSQWGSPMFVCSFFKEQWLFLCENIPTILFSPSMFVSWFYFERKDRNTCGEIRFSCKSKTFNVEVFSSFISGMSFITIPISRYISFVFLYHKILFFMLLFLLDISALLGTKLDKDYIFLFCVFKIDKPLYGSLT